MNVRRLSTVRIVLLMTGAILLLAFAAHAEQSGATSCSCPPATTHATPEEAKHLPRHGSVRAETAPPKALFGMIWNDTKSNREYIFDGNEWVPHDRTVDDYNAAKIERGPGARRNGGGK